jgi:ribosomal RNA-processing protein 12
MQVCVMSLPTEILEQHLRQILEGLLLWSEDSKNKFKLKVALLEFLNVT